MISFRCPSCFKEAMADDHLVNNFVTCPYCQSLVDLAPGPFENVSVGKFKPKRKPAVTGIFRLLFLACMVFLFAICVLVALAPWLKKQSHAHIAGILSESLQEWRAGFRPHGFRDQDCRDGAILLRFDIGLVKETGQTHQVQATLFIESRARTELVKSKIYTIKRHPDGDYDIFGQTLGH